MSEKSEYSYIGRKPCGCVVGMVADSVKHPESTARWVYDFIMEGLTVERVTCEEASRLFRIKCTHEPKQLNMFGEGG